MTPLPSVESKGCLNSGDFQKERARCFLSSLNFKGDFREEVITFSHIERTPLHNSPHFSIYDGIRPTILTDQRNSHKLMSAYLGDHSNISRLHQILTTKSHFHVVFSLNLYALVGNLCERNKRP